MLLKFYEKGVLPPIPVSKSLASKRIKVSTKTFKGDTIMPWVTISQEELAAELGIDYETVKAKHDLISKIVKTRKKYNLTQQDLANMVGKSQSYIAKIESGIGTKNFSFDVLLNILSALGYEYKITTKKVSEPDSLVA